MLLPFGRPAPAPRLPIEVREVPHAALDRAKVGQRPAKPAVVHERQNSPFRFHFDRFAGLAILLIGGTANRKLEEASQAAAHLARIPGRGDGALISQSDLVRVPVLALPD